MKDFFRSVLESGDELRSLQLLEERDPIGARPGELEEATKRYRQLQEQARAIIDAIPSRRHRQVLTLRYLCGMSWSEITDEMGYSEEKSAFRVHGRALQMAEK